jgi:hypothetical protein
MRRFPGLDQVDIDDLAKLLAATTEREVRKNTVLAKRGSPVGAAYFIIEGELRVTTAPDPSRAAQKQNRSGYWAQTRSLALSR